MAYLISIISTFALSVLLTGFLRKFALSRGWVTKPRKRDVHKKPMPRVGGIAIFLSFFIVSLIFFLAHPDLSFGPSAILGMDRRLLAIWIGGFLITGLMFFDDLFGLKAWQKLIIQIFVALIMIAGGIGIDQLANPFGDPANLNSIYIPLFSYKGVIYHFSLLSDLLTLIWIVGLMNILNFVDGVDGLAGGLATISSLVIFFLSISVLVNQPATAMVAMILAGASLGFLVWNFPPAKIFMGDSGSMFLGLMLGVLPLISGGKLATVFLVLGFPIIDGFFVAFGRLFRGQNPLTTPDKTHLHHRFLDSGFSPRQAVLTMYAISIAFGWVALRSSTENKMIAASVLVVLLLALLGILRLVKKRRGYKLT